jgi:hypothetical protein
MVSPGGVADVEGSWAELGEEFSNDAESTSAGEGLEGCNLAVVDHGVTESESDTAGSFVEVSETILG